MFNIIDYTMIGKRLSWSYVDATHIDPRLKGARREQLIEFLQGWSTGESQCFAGMYGIDQNFIGELKVELDRTGIPYEVISNNGSINFNWELRILK